jgi:hypothetical protein
MLRSLRITKFTKNFSQDLTVYLKLSNDCVKHLGKLDAGANPQKGPPCPPSLALSAQTLEEDNELLESRIKSRKDNFLQIL